jgi:glycosyltransferase involved in cell wall biosynthesis
MNTYGCLAALLGRIPIITTVHGKAYYGDKWRRRLAYRCVARSSFRMVAVSEDIRRFLVQEVGVRPDRVSTIYNGIDVKAYYPSERGATVRGELGIAPAAPVIGMVGSLYPVKGHTYLLQAAVRVVKAFPLAVFLIVGRGGLLDQLREQAQQLGIGAHVRFLGFSEDIPPLLQAMDIFALPSLSEGLSLSLLEAMAAGKPAVATAVGGNPEVVLHEETGFLVPSQDVEALACRIISLLKDQAMAHQFGVHGQRRALETFSVEHMVNAYQDLYQEALLGR